VLDARHHGSFEVEARLVTAGYGHGLQLRHHRRLPHLTAPYLRFRRWKRVNPDAQIGLSFIAVGIVLLVLAGATLAL
jgi:hypothetical protein